MNTPRYSMLIQWSDEDWMYVVSLPEFGEVVASNPVTGGTTYEEAARNGQEALEALIGSLQQHCEPLPKPNDQSTGEPARG